MMGHNDGNEIEKLECQETYCCSGGPDAEYYEFIEETGYSFIPSHWENGKPVVGQENDPVRYVNMADINAFAFGVLSATP